jgi:hypothetical protein
MLKINKILTLVLLVAIAYFLGAYSYYANLWPIYVLRQYRNDTSQKLVSTTANIFDDYGRLIYAPQKQAVACPVQSADTAVLLVIGQSNAANHAEKNFTTQYPQQVFNYFNGQCYVAASPLLGASGEQGEFITPLADNLITNKVYNSVIIVSSAIGGTSIIHWQKDGNLNEMLISTLKQLSTQYKITEIIWHQGESDFVSATPQKIYINAFNSLLTSLAENNITAPVFISISTKCGPGMERNIYNPGASGVWDQNNSVALGQKKLIDNSRVFLGR